MNHHTLSLNCRLLQTLATSCLLCLGFQALALSPPTRTEIQTIKAAGDYEERLIRMRALNDYKVNAGLAQRAAFRLGRATGQAYLAEGRLMAFPFTQQPELISIGSPKTITILVDFADYRAADTLPGLTTNAFYQTMYGDGTPTAQNYAPFESVRNFYRRASQGRLQLAGNVLGWYHFPKKQDDYKPKIPVGSSNDDRFRLENQAIFDLTAEALRHYDSTHDFSQYDNDHDGDIDLVTIVYAGTNGGWGSFWWAYQSQFYTPGAFANRFDGKRLKQFVFTFVSLRGDGDFDPKTVIHETGHAFGLPDYYDYDTSIGPQGGLGGLDIMDGLVGNHNAFSRWLLDWIQPVVIGSAPPTLQTLMASGLAAKTNEAVAIFPNLSNVGPPRSEFFIFENRQRVGNDGGASENPGEGLLVWHVDATPNGNGDGFAYNNSYTTPKLIRLMRANNPQDFSIGEWANADTYFTDISVFSPSSQPSSADNIGNSTGVSLQNISPTGNMMTALIGIEPGIFSALKGNSPTNQISINAAPSAPSVSSAPPPTTTKPVSDWEAREEALRLATPAELSAIWRTNGVDPGIATNVSTDTFYWENVLTTWASKDGRAALNALLAMPTGKFKEKLYPLVLEAWAHNDPQESYAWYSGADATTLRSSTTLLAGPQFFRAVFEWKGVNNLDAALTSLSTLRKVDAMDGAYRGVTDASQRFGLTEDTLLDRAKSQSIDVTGPKAITHARDLLDYLRNEVKDPAMQHAVQQMLNEKTAPEQK